MTKLLIIGSSHLGAIKMGWDEIATEFPDLQPDFFGAPAEDFWKFEVNDAGDFGALDPKKFSPARLKKVTDLQGRDRVDLTAYDTVLLVGLPFKELFFAEMLAKFSVDGLYEVNGRPRLSVAARNHFCDEVIEQNLPDPMWRNWTKTRLLVIPKPRISETCINGESPRMRPWKKLAQEKPGAEILDWFLKRTKERWANAGVEMVLPPASVYGDSGLTRADMARTAKNENLDNDFDHSHMNAAFGAETLRHILPEL